MAFVFEKVLEKDVPFFNSLGIKNWTGNHPKEIIPGRTTWCVDREKKAFLMGLGGGRADEPHISVFWWDGFEIRIEENSTTEKSKNGKLVSRILRMLIPKKAYDKRNEIAQLILEALMVIQDHDEISLDRKINNEYIIDEDTIIEYSSE